MVQLVWTTFIMIVQYRHWKSNVIYGRHSYCVFLCNIQGCPHCIKAPSLEDNVTMYNHGLSQDTTTTANSTVDFHISSMDVHTAWDPLSKYPWMTM